MEPLQIFQSLLDELHKAPLSLMVIVALNLVGLVLKFIPRFPNGWIPALLTLVLGPVTMIFCGDRSVVAPTVPHPEAVLALYGAIFGFVAWAIHGLLLKRFEKYLPAGTLDIDKPAPDKPDATPKP